MEDVAQIAPKYAIGGKFYIPSTKTEQRKRDCPDCLGEKLFKVISPAGDEFSLNCPRCSGDTWVRDVPSLIYNHHVATVGEHEIAGYCVNEWGEAGIQYRSRSGHSVKEADLITSKEVAEEAAEAMAALANAKAEKEPVRIHHDNLGNLKLREAALDQFKYGLYDSWSAFRNLRETVDEIIQSDSYDYSDREKIVEALEDQLSQTHRYDFVFKGFTRAMEAVVALVNADPAAEPEVLQALRDQWSKLPEQAQQVWKPHDKIAKDWSGNALPTF